jgi:hypothetical protein
MRSVRKKMLVFEKYNGKCAYTGRPLGDEWQVDHMIPRCRIAWGLHPDMDANHIDNLMPALGIVNHYKRAMDLEMFRKYMMSFHKRLKKVPKKTVSPSRAKYKVYMESVANAFGISIDKPFDGVFYFETLNNQYAIQEQSGGKDSNEGDCALL